MENQPHHWTNNVYLFNTFISFLFTHPMWDVTDTEVKTLCTLTISTHTSRVGCDKIWSTRKYHFSTFLLTHPVWDVTRWRKPLALRKNISTHTSRVGCDVTSFSYLCFHLNFYSHIPCGMWPVVFRCGGRIWKFLLTHPVWDVTKVQGITGTNSKFLLTHPVWDVTCVPNFGTFLMRISTHTSRVGCDPLATAALKLLIHFYSHIPCGMWHFTTFHEWLYSKNFYSHIPCGMWRSAVPYSLIGMKFLLTHPVWDVTQVSGTVYDIYEISTHTSRVGCDLHAQEKIRNISSFLLTHPVWDVTQNPTVFLIWQKNFYSHIPCGMWLATALKELQAYRISTHTSRVGCDV